MRYLMIPTKNVSLGQSVIGISSIVYKIVRTGKYSIDEVFEQMKKDYISNGILKYSIDFNQYILSLCFLYTLKKININENGVICCEID